MDLLPHVRSFCVTSELYLWLLILGSLSIAIPYLIIPRVLHWILREAGPGAPGAVEIRGVARFVRCCGWTHLFAVAVLFAPALDYPAVAWLFVTGGVSITSAVRLCRGRRGIAAALGSIRTLGAHVANAR